MKIPEISKKQGIVGFFLIICLIVLATLFLKMSKENARCMKNPLVYGAEELSEQGLEIICSCASLDPKYPGFVFNKNNITAKEHPYSDSRIVFDPGLINITNE